ncbi:MAG: cupin domain-containing protein [Myxococcales bacterium]|nr:cupin domain-containing protein [Myxococcales bacterium]
MNPPIINIADLAFRPFGHGVKMPGAGEARDVYQAQIGAVGPLIGARLLGYNITVIAPGKRAFPLHNHRVNEEMFFILEGTGEVRIGEARHPIKVGDVIACPPGGPETAHQLCNTSDTDELRFLAVSTRLSPEIAEYPETGRFGVLAELSPGADGKPNVFRYIGRPDGSLPYWEGE